MDEFNEKIMSETLDWMNFRFDPHIELFLEILLATEMAIPLSHLSGSY